MTDDSSSEASLREDGESSFAGEILDELLPDDLDWRRQVRRYPIPALVIAGLAGFYLGSRHGAEIRQALSSFATREVERNLSRFPGGDARRRD